MKVIALKDGFYNRYITAGETFDVLDDSDASWFVPADNAGQEKNKVAAKDAKPARSKNAVKGEEAA